VAGAICEKERDALVKRCEFYSPRRYKHVLARENFPCGWHSNLCKASCSTCYLPSLNWPQPVQSKYIYYIYDMPGVIPTKEQYLASVLFTPVDAFIVKQTTKYGDCARRGKNSQKFARSLIKSEIRIRFNLRFVFSHNPGLFIEMFVSDIKIKKVINGESFKCNKFKFIHFIAKLIKIKYNT